ncbi:unnamed protein product, partial [Mesorhabditis spiculigera]
MQIFQLEARAPVRSLLNIYSSTAKKHSSTDATLLKKLLDEIVRNCNQNLDVDCRVSNARSLGYHLGTVFEECEFKMPVRLQRVLDGADRLAGGGCAQDGLENAADRCPEGALADLKNMIQDRKTFLDAAQKIVGQIEGMRSDTADLAIMAVTIESAVNEAIEVIKHHPRDGPTWEDEFPPPDPLSPGIIVMPGRKRLRLAVLSTSSQESSSEEGDGTEAARAIEDASEGANRLFDAPGGDWPEEIGELSEEGEPDPGGCDESTDEPVDQFGGNVLTEDTTLLYLTVAMDYNLTIIRSKLRISDGGAYSTGLTVDVRVQAAGIISAMLEEIRDVHARIHSNDPPEDTRSSQEFVENMETMQQFEENQLVVQLMLNTDGFDMKPYSNASCWPYYGAIWDLEPERRGEQSSHILIGATSIPTASRGVGDVIEAATAKMMERVRELLRDPIRIEKNGEIFLVKCIVAATILDGDAVRKLYKTESWASANGFCPVCRLLVIENGRVISLTDRSNVRVTRYSLRAGILRGSNAEQGLPVEVIRNTAFSRLVPMNLVMFDTLHWLDLGVFKRLDSVLAGHKEDLLFGLPAKIRQLLTGLESAVILPTYYATTIRPFDQGNKCGKEIFLHVYIMGSVLLGHGTLAGLKCSPLMAAQLLAMLALIYTARRLKELKIPKSELAEIADDLEGLGTVFETVFGRMNMKEHLLFAHLGQQLRRFVPAQQHRMRLYYLVG